MLSPPSRSSKSADPGSPRTGGLGECVGRGRASIAVGAASLAVVAAAFGVFFLWFAISLGGALTNPALGSSTGARAAEWFRGHGGASIVVWAENEWYSHHQPKVGGTPRRRNHSQAESDAHHDTGRRHGRRTCRPRRPSRPLPARPLRARASGRRSAAP